MPDPRPRRPSRRPSCADARADLASLGGHGWDWRPLAPGRADVDVDVTTARRSAVLMLFGPADPMATDGPVAPAEASVLLLRRADGLTHHPGQIGFPGGGVEPGDRDVSATAVREAEEETGLDPSGLELFDPLPAVPLAVSDHLVTPVPAWWRQPSPVWAADPIETAEVFTARVSDLIDPTHRAVVTRVRGMRTPPMPAFDVDGHLVWGFTAILLAGLLDRLEWSVPWDRSRAVEPVV